MRARDRIHVVAGALVNSRDEVLVARRPDGVHQGGLWEFPGGKLEPGESPAAGLARELEEELGVKGLHMRRLIRVAHDYPDRPVLLDVWRVDAWEGEPSGREGQPIDWVARESLADRPFPAADFPVLAALRLPSRYLITPEPAGDGSRFLATLAESLAAGVRLVELRIKGSRLEAWRDLIAEARDLCSARRARLLLNADADAETAARLGMDGVHLDSRRLLATERRPGGGPRLVAASCHDGKELAHAGRLGLDFAVLSPVKPTRSHPLAAPLGWERFEALATEATLPVYALGGMTVDDLPDAWRAGAQGIAAIRGLWGRGRTAASVRDI